MKEIYAWVPWFRELAQKIAEGGEAGLIEGAKRVDWDKEKPALLNYGDENIDPFSFFYFLAQRNTLNQRKPIYTSVSEVFDVDSQHCFSEKNLEESFIIPTPSSNSMALFHDGNEGRPDLLWKLFHQAVHDDDIADDVFKGVLNIKQVGVAKLTQCLFLINPLRFMPVDAGILEFHDALNLPSFKEAKRKIEQPTSWESYKKMLSGFRAAFPGCCFYEINTALFLMGCWKKKNIAIGKNFFQVSTNVIDDGDDYWEEFQNENWVRTGAPAPNTPWDATEIGNPYPIRDANNGDIILVRYGQTNGRAIGIVYKNDYADKGLSAESVIHVLWLNQTPTRLARHTEQTGFSILHDGSATYQAFAGTDLYRPTFKLIQLVSGKEIAEKSQYKVEDTAVGKETINDDNKMKHPLNQILYGPPGTGKTWNAVNHALAIIEGKPVAQLASEDRDSVKRRFDQLKEGGQIEMVTFHQNFSYEDFIEGIKPILGDDSDNVRYKIVDGVFKSIADQAKEDLIKPHRNNEELDLDALLEAFADDIEGKLEEGQKVMFRSPNSTIDREITKVNRKDNGNFRSVSVCTTTQRINRLARQVIERDYVRFYNGEIKSHDDIGPRWKKKLKKHPQSRLYFDLYERIKKFHGAWNPTEPQSEHAAAEGANYVLIIDEINRGNIAKIFGELITLIEDTKRIGNKDSMTVTLPYSSNSDDEDDSFGVPNNLYLIGTMNTADRSIALLDTALRRRFDFIEMMPEPELISDNVEGVNCRELLTVMNKRITALLDREHQIGHSYLMDVVSMETLARVFQNKIVPLLQEYFYDDWAKIALVLNKNGFVTTTEIDTTLFSDTELVDADRLIYELIGADDKKWASSDSYTPIYATAKPTSDKADGG